MSTFVVVAALLTVAVLVALWLALRRVHLRPGVDEAASNVRILRVQLAELRADFDAGTIDAATFDAARAELDRRVLAEAAPDAAGATTRSLRGSLVLLLGVPVLASVLYAALGNRAALEAAPAQPVPALTQQDIDTMVERLAQRMQADPSDPEGWRLLARSYMAMQRFDAAREAFAQAVQRLPGDAELLADYADASGMAQGRSLQGEPEQLIARALHADPDNLKALALAGTAALQRGDAKTAATHFERALRVAPADSPYVAGLQDGLRQAQGAALAPPATSTPPPPAVAAAVAATLTVEVALAPALAGRLQAGDTLFVFARAAEGPRMPLAIARQTLRADTRWPLTVTLDDAMAMTPQTRLSGATRVVVGARISRSGQATPETGDLEGQSAPVATSGAARLTIDQVR